MSSPLSPTTTFGQQIEDLEWIDDFAASIRPYIRVRLEDGVLIKMPTEVFKLNPTGLLLLEKVLAGRKIRDVALEAKVEGNPNRIAHIHAFFCDVRDLLSERLGDGRNRRATSVQSFEGSFYDFPVLSEIAITYRCNLACTFCYAGCGTPDATPGNAHKERHRDRWRFWRKWFPDKIETSKRDPIAEEMTREEILEVIDKIALDAHVPSVSFTGGESTLRPELPEFIAHARSRNMRVNIITNGLRCASPTYVAELARAGLNSAQVSLEGPTPEIHDAMTQKPGSFAGTLRGIKNLRAADIHVHTNTTICEENADHLTGIIDLAKSLDLPHVSMNHIIPTGTSNLPRHERIRVSYEHIGDLVLAARNHADRIGIRFHWYSPTPFCIFNPIAHGLGNKGCAACDSLLHVSPSGEVLPCSSFARGVGNILESGFKDVWKGKNASHFRKKQAAHPICKNCEHFALCQGACTLYWSEMGFGELWRARFKNLFGAKGDR